MAFYCNGKKDVCACDILCADCKFYDNSGGKKVQTNGDRIRAMSDEELAKHFSGLICDINEGVEYHADPSRWLEWLKQPAEGE